MGIRNLVYSSISTQFLKLHTTKVDIQDEYGDEIKNYLLEESEELKHFFANEPEDGKKYLKRSGRSAASINELYHMLNSKYVLDGKLDISSLSLRSDFRSDGGIYAVDACKTILSHINELEIYKFCYENIPQMYSSIITNIGYLDIEDKDKSNIHAIGTILLHYFSKKSHESLEIHIPSNLIKNDSIHTLEHISKKIKDVSDIIGLLLNKINVSDKNLRITLAKKVFLEHLDISNDFTTFIGLVSEEIIEKENLRRTEEALRHSEEEHVATSVEVAGHSDDAEKRVRTKLFRSKTLPAKSSSKIEIDPSILTRSLSDTPSESIIAKLMRGNDLTREELETLPKLIKIDSTSFLKFSKETEEEANKFYNPKELHENMNHNELVIIIFKIREMVEELIELNIKIDNVLDESESKRDSLTYAKQKAKHYQMKKQINEMITEYNFNRSKRINDSYSNEMKYLTPLSIYLDSNIQQFHDNINEIISQFGSTSQSQ